MAPEPGLPIGSVLFEIPQDVGGDLTEGARAMRDLSQILGTGKNTADCFSAVEAHGKQQIRWVLAHKRLHRAAAYQLLSTFPEQHRQDYRSVLPQSVAAIGRETACGDPIFLSTKPPYPVFTAMHGQGSWDPSVIAPSLEQFWRCLGVYRAFAAPVGGSINYEANTGNRAEVDAYIQQISSICDGDEEAVFSWALWGGINLLDENPAAQP